MHLYPRASRSGSLHGLYPLRLSANLAMKSYTSSENFSAVANNPSDSGYHDLSYALCYRLFDIYSSEAHFLISFLLYARASSDEDVFSGPAFSAAFFCSSW